MSHAWPQAPTHAFGVMSNTLLSLVETPGRPPPRSVNLLRRRRLLSAACALALSFLVFSLAVLPLPSFLWCPKRFLGACTQGHQRVLGGDRVTCAFLFSFRFFRPSKGVRTGKWSKRTLEKALLSPNPAPLRMWPEAYPRGGIRGGGCVLFSNISSLYSFHCPFRLCQDTGQHR